MRRRMKKMSKTIENFRHLNVTNRFLFTVIKLTVAKAKDLVLLLALLFLSCSNVITGMFTNENCYIIDLDVEKEISILYSSIFKNVKTIILETDNDCLLGLITELQVFDGCIYVLDAYIAKSLFVFDMEGRFLHKIGSLGQGPGEYLKVSDFTIDIENRFIFLLDYGKFVHKYHLDGTFINTINLQIERANTHFIQFYNNRLYASFYAWDTTPDDYMIMEIDPMNGKTITQSLPIKYNKEWAESVFTGHSFFMSRLSSPPRYTQLFMNFVVSIGEEITPYIELKSDYLVTNKDLENLSIGMFGDKLSSLQGKSKIWDVHCFVENEDFILLKYVFGYIDRYIAIFDKKTNTTKITKKLKNDLILIQDNDFLYSNGNFRFSDINGVYEIILRPEILIKHDQENNLVPDLDQIDRLKMLDEDSNPIIFYYEFK